MGRYIWSLVKDASQKKIFFFWNSEIITCLLFSPTIMGTVKAKKTFMHFRLKLLTSCGEFKDSRKLLLGVLVWNSLQSAGVSIKARNWHSSTTFKRSYFFQFSENSLSCGVLLIAPFQAEPPIATSAASYGQSYWNLWISLILNLSSWFRWVNLKQFLKLCFFLTKWSAFWVMNSRNKMPCLKIYKIYFVVLFTNEFLGDAPCSME